MPHGGRWWAGESLASAWVTTAILRLPNRHTLHYDWSKPQLEIAANADLEKSFPRFLQEQRTAT